MHPVPLALICFVGMMSGGFAETVTITQIPKSDGLPDPFKIHQEHLLEVKDFLSYKIWTFPGSEPLTTSGTLEPGPNKIYMDLIKRTDRQFKIEIHQVGKGLIYSREFVYTYPVEVYQPQPSWGGAFDVDPSKDIGLDAIAVIPKQFSIDVMQGFNYTGSPFSPFGFFWSIAGKPALLNKEIHGEQFQVILKCVTSLGH